ncbi:type II secretion system F family protein [Bacterioplanoides sp. SCSIO 12839]|uniref:type II secretion system F family protein n=1 Tax=Bacterioplanoides sp. SCSIO 12839 TaxID=2829569 RepID=UPI00210489C0|nr:type II secretion system F family protein [Bacterioplanoides sp. SCSIO 12839]UTW49545.1 type II secretion system F family protein [Bacterioplanoides sp. SCSIO 12839]
MNGMQALIIALMLLVMALLALLWVFSGDKRLHKVQQRWQQKLLLVNDQPAQPLLSIPERLMAVFSRQQWLHVAVVWMKSTREKLRGLAVEDEDRFERVFVVQVLFVWLLVLVLLIQFQAGFSGFSIFLLATAGAAFFAWLRWQSLKKKLLSLYEEQLPGVVDHIRRAVSSGLSVPQALASSALQADAPVAIELQRISQQLQLGIALNQVIAESRLRIPVREFHFLGMILVLNQKTGGRLAEALENLSTGLRERKAMKMKLASMTSEPKATALIVSAFPPLTLLGLIFFQPHQVEFLLQDPTGQMISLYVIGSVTFGLTAVHRMARGGLA